MKNIGLISGAVVAAACQLSVLADTLWIEGEAAGNARVVPSDWVTSFDPAQLSGRALLGNKGGEGLVKYAFTVDAATERVGWVRCGVADNLLLSVRVDGGEWRRLELGKSRSKEVCGPNLGLHYLGWVSWGELSLSAGTHELDFRMDSPGDKAGVIDCIVFCGKDEEPWKALFADRLEALPDAAAKIHDGIIWVEGEAAVVNQMTPAPWWYDKLKGDAFSEAKWVSNFSIDKPGVAVYPLKIPSAGRYRLLLHANPMTECFEYRLGNGDWHVFKPVEMAKRVNVASDGGLDLRFIAWLDAGMLDLPAGRCEVALRFSGKAHNNHGILDCFVLVPEAKADFSPDVAQRPWEPQPTVVTDKGYWRFEPQSDAFSAASLLDLRSLNEAYAGEHGFVRATPAGAFVRGDGEPIRFWGVGCSVMAAHPLELENNARFLAKRGVNMVRFHGMGPLRPDAGAKRLEARDRLWRLVAAMKREGIYTTYSAYYPHAEKGTDNWGEGVDQETTSCLLFFYEPVQKLYKQMLRDFLLETNPYTGISLRDDPALAMIQMQNEDGMLFWTTMSLTGKPLEVLTSKFQLWAEAKYGSKEKVIEAWYPGGVPAGSGETAGLENLWLWTREATDGKQRKPTRRSLDQLAFFTDTMRVWNQEFVRFMREELQCKQMLNIGNWRTVDDTMLMDLERSTYGVGDVIAKNNYNPSIHKGNYAGWAIVVGDKFDNVSRTRSPGLIPCNLKQVVGKPMIIPECLWAPPNAYQVEGPLLSSAYMSLSGVDSLYWFEVHEPQWLQPSSANGYLPSLGKFRAETPALMGQFPATALLFRKGYVSQGEPVVVEHRTYSSMLALEKPLIAEFKPFDPNVDEKYDVAMAEGLQVNPLAYLVGPVLVEYSEAPGLSQISPTLTACLDAGKSRVRSNTGELSMEYGKGLFRMDTPKGQGFCGFLKEAGAVGTSDLTLTCSNEFAVVVAVALDDKPLSVSQKILVQTGTPVRSLGWKDRESVLTFESGRKQTVREVVNIGQAPWMVEKNRMTVKLRSSSVTRLVPLDMNGIPLPTVRNLRSENGFVSVEIPEDGMYFLITD